MFNSKVEPVEHVPDHLNNDASDVFHKAANIIKDEKSFIQRLQRAAALFFDKSKKSKSFEEISIDEIDNTNDIQSS